MRFGIGGTWGLSSFWGITHPFCELADERVLIQMDDETSNRKFRDLICDLVEGLEQYVDVLNAVKVAFDIDSAVGVQLDAIGGVVGLPRQGFNDDRYRVFLEIQIELLISANRDDAEWTGTIANLLTISRTFIGTGILAPVIYTASGPSSYFLTVPGIVLAELLILINFICRATYAGVLGQVQVILADDSLWNSESVGPFLNEGNWNSASVAVAPPMIWNFSVPIGTQPCE